MRCGKDVDWLPDSTFEAADGVLLGTAATAAQVILRRCVRIDGRLGRIMLLPFGNLLALVVRKRRFPLCLYLAPAQAIDMREFAALDLSGKLLGVMV